MAMMRINTETLLSNINGFGGGASPSALQCVAQLQEVFDQIERTALQLEGVWDDEAQRIFLERFRQKHADVALYLTDLKTFFGEITAAVEKVKAWDFALGSKLGQGSWDS